MLLSINIHDRDPRIVRAKLEYHLRGVALSNQLVMETHDMPSLYDSGVRYRVDPRSAAEQLVLDCIEVLSAGEADCKSLAVYQLGYYRAHAATPELAEGYGLIVGWKDFSRDPLGVGLVPVDGVCRVFHVELTLPDGTREDPSSLVQRAA